MTLPDERFAAVEAIRVFLGDLLSPVAIPCVPRHVRERAARCLRHYPTQFDVVEAALAAPEIFEVTEC